MEIKENINLANYSSFKIGGKARYFLKAKKREEILKGIEWLKEKKLPFLILGGGSNILFSDKGFKGLVIKLEIKNCKFKDNEVFVEAGYSLTKLIFECLKKGLSGLEFLAGIPGTVGGTIYGNSGAFGKEIKDVVKEVEVLKIRNWKLEIRKLKNKDCQFGYRDSIFKKKKGWIILAAKLELKRKKKKEIEKRIKKFLKMRKEKQPFYFPSAGSVFKNVPLKKVPKEVQKKFKEKIKGQFLAAGVLIEAAGLKGYQIKGAKISEKHANFILNIKKAKARDVLKLINLAKKRVKEKFKIVLEEEIEFY